MLKCPIMTACRARQRAEQRHSGASELQIEDELARVRPWASGLDRCTNSFDETEQGLYAQSAPPQEVVDIIQRNATDAQQSVEAAKLKVNYYLDAWPRFRLEDTPH
jgi:hypothetical protein